jgi:phage gp46-like protein
MNHQRLNEDKSYEVDNGRIDVVKDRINAVLIAFLTDTRGSKMEWWHQMDILSWTGAHYRQRIDQR